MPSDLPVVLSPISDADIDRVAAFLHEHLNERVEASEWARSLTPPWRVEAPNRGFQLTHDDVVVGVHLAFYSERVIRGRKENFCNLGAWCVREDYRQHSIRLLRAVLRQKAYQFTDFSPSGAVVPLNKRLKFSSLDTSTALIPNLPWPLFSRNCRVVTDPAGIRARLTGADLAIYLDHAQARGARHLVLSCGEEACYVLYRRDRRKNLPLFASILYVGDRSVFHRYAAVAFRHLLLREHVLGTLAELRVIGERPALSRMLSSPRPKMFLSDDLTDADIDYLYSELECVAW